MILHDKSNKINQCLALSAPTKNEHTQELKLAYSRDVLI